MANEYSEYFKELEKKKRAPEVLSNMKKKYTGVSPDIHTKTKAINPQSVKKASSSNRPTYLITMALVLLGIVVNASIHKSDSSLKKNEGIILENQEVTIPTNLSLDEQAIFWTYAIYDFEKLTTTFKVNSQFNVNQVTCHKNLVDLLPKVSANTLRTIIAYDGSMVKYLKSEVSK
jgi:uncharacterized membrane-anchored protein